MQLRTWIFWSKYIFMQKGNKLQKPIWNAICLYKHTFWHQLIAFWDAYSKSKSNRFNNDLTIVFVTVKCKPVLKGIALMHLSIFCTRGRAVGIHGTYDRRWFPTAGWNLTHRMISGPCEIDFGRILDPGISAWGFKQRYLL